jgi:hypothetical protein
LEPESILTTAIEVAIGIAGFSAVVMAIGPRSGNEWPESARLALSALLLMSLSTVVFGFLPLLLLSAAAPESTTWRISSGTHATYLVAVGVYRSRQLLRLPDDGIPRTNLSVVVGMVLVVIILLQVTNAFWLCMPWPYLTSIVLMVVLAFTVFVGLLWRLWSAA